LSEIDGTFQADSAMYGLEQTPFEPVIPGDITNDEPRYVPELSEGDSVRHQIFGVGTVMELDGDNATIYFKGRGAKKLNISFAPLEKL
jgi:hypothetical protein